MNMVFNLKGEPIISNLDEFCHCVCPCACVCLQSDIFLVLSLQKSPGNSIPLYNCLHIWIPSTQTTNEPGICSND